ncbi:MAG: acyl-CoA dehydrogenase [Alphaproteobacteria bacterium]|nr:acyl-CoA dehydrogenase [Alphaproteobacteria bacterium]
MDITLNEDHVMLRDTALSFAQGALTKARIRELETTEHGFDTGVWQEMTQMGWAAACFPEKYGGAEASLFELALIVEALGNGAVPSPIFSTVIESGFLLLDAASAPQKDEWLQRIAEGEALLTVALMEANGGLRPQDVKAAIVRAGNGFRIDGTKAFVRDAGAADGIISLVRSGERPEDLTLALVPKDAKGVSMRRMPAAGGEALWEVAFNGVEVNADAIVSEMGGAWPWATRLLLRGAAFKSAELVGIGGAALDLTVEYAKQRVQFGKPIGSFQGVQHHCAEMYRDLEVSRLLSWQASSSMGAGLAGEREVAMAKAKASQCIPALTRTAHQIHGAIAYYRDYPLELYYHRALAAQAAYGDAAYHRRTLARLLTSDKNSFRGADPHELPVHYF